MYWRSPILSEEYGEIQRTAKSLRIPIRMLREAFEIGQLRRLTNKLWAQVRNTESWECLTLEQLWLVGNQYGKNIPTILKGLRGYYYMPAPIILERPGKAPYLVSGNTRLCACRAIKIQPRAHWIKVG